jgi:DNA-binding transcriptional LysR family regulator
VSDGTEREQLPYLETFAKAAELSNFTAAAKVLGLTQAAVSQRVQAVEKALGKSLFRRQGGRVVVTESGQRLYGYAQRILGLHREARHDVAGQKVVVPSELIVGASSVPGEHLLPRLLPAFCHKYPHIKVRVEVSDTTGVIEQVERGKVSFGLVGSKTSQPHLEFRYLATDRMVLVVPPGHPLSRRKRVSVSELAKHPLVLREPGSGLRHCFTQALERAGRSLCDFRIALELGSNEAIRKAVMRGAGVAMLSIYAVQKELKARELRAVQVDDLRCERDMFIVMDRRRVMPVAARLFLTFLDAHRIEEAL